MIDNPEELKRLLHREYDKFIAWLHDPVTDGFLRWNLEEVTRTKERIQFDLHDVVACAQGQGAIAERTAVSDGSRMREYLNYRLRQLRDDYEHRSFIAGINAESVAEFDFDSGDAREPDAL
jgi:hypothetical protein